MEAESSSAVALSSPTTAPQSSRRAHGLSLDAPPVWLWLLAIALQVVSAAAVTSYTYFFVDDWLFLAQARTQPFGLTYLREGLFEHFSPITRLADLLVVNVSVTTFTFAHAIELALYLACIAAFAVLMCLILGNRWLAFIFTLCFGQSLFLMRLLTWWTATVNILPASVFALVTIIGYLRWRRDHARRWLAVCLVAFAAALLDYETAMLLPLYLALLGLFVLQEDLRPRAVLASLWSERWLWLGLVVLEAAALINYYTGYYVSMARPTLGQTLHYLAIALPETFVPALAGINNPDYALGRSPAVIVISCLVFAGLVTYVIYTRQLGLRCFVAFLVAAVATMVPVGINRIMLFGIGIGHELYYEQAVQYMFFVFAALAIASPRTRELRLRPKRTALTRSVLVIGACAVIATYVVLYTNSLRATRLVYWPPTVSRAYVTTLKQSVSRVRAATGHEPTLIDQQVPTGIVPASYAPFNNYDELLPLLLPGVPINRASTVNYVITSTGSLQPVRFTALARGVLGRSSITVLGSAKAVPAASEGRGACIRVRGEDVTLHIPLRTSEQIATGTLPFALHIVGSVPSRTTVTFLLQGSTLAVDNRFPAVWPAGPVDWIQPLSIAMRTSTVDLVLPTGSCVDDVQLGKFTPAGPAI